MSMPQMIESNGGGGRKIEGRHVLIGLVGFFLAIIGVNLVMAYMAITTYSGIDTPDAYRKGLAYNTRIAAETRQAALGWREAVTWETSQAPLKLTLTDTQGNPVSGLHVTASLGRPATNRYDRVLVMSERAPGTYEVRVADADAGNWAVEIKASRLRSGSVDQVYETRRRLWLKP